MTKNKKYIVAIEYPLDLFLSDNNVDETYEKIIGREHSGSGAGFGVRDLEWAFGRSDAAYRAWRKLTKCKELDKCTLYCDMEM